MRVCQAVLFALIGLPLLRVEARVDWDVLVKVEGEVTFLNGAVEAVEAADVKEYPGMLLALDELSPVRQQATSALIVSTWLQRNPESLHDFVIQNWEPLGEGLQAMFFYAVAHENPQTAVSLLEKHDVMAEYWDEFVEILAWENPKVAVQYLDRVIGRDTRQQLAGLIVYSWLDEYPDEALEWALEHDDLIEVGDLLQSLVYRDEYDDPDQILALWSRLPETERTAERQYELANQLSYWKPELALLFLEGLSQEQYADVIDTVISALADEQSPKAAELLQQVPAEQLPEIYSLKEVLLEWGLREPDEALVWADSIPDPETRQTALLRMNTVLGMLNPELAIEQAMATPKGELYDQMIRNVSLLLAKADLESGFAWAAALEEGSAKTLAADSLSAMGDFYAPDVLMSQAIRFPDGEAKDTLMRGLFRRWAAADLPSAMAEVYASGPELAGEFFENEVAMQLTFHRPELALEYLESSELRLSARRELFESYLDRYSEKPEMMALLLDRLQPSQLQGVVRNRDLSDLVEHDPEVAFQLMPYVEDVDHERAYLSIMNEWTSEDPMAVGQYLQMNRSSELVASLPNHFYQQIAQSWSGMDFASTVQWIEELEDVNVREQAEYGLAKQLMNTAPQEAFDYLQTMEGDERYAQESQRYMIYRDLIEQWSYYDPAAAEAALEDAQLAERHRKNVLSQLKKPE